MPSASANPLAAIARSILVIIFHLLADRETRYHDLGPDHYDTRTGRDRKIRNHIRHIQALGLQVTITAIEPAA
jgi:transposase